MSFDTALIPTLLILQSTKSFTQAAKILRLSQPSVSRQLQAAEEQLGFSLFHRTQRKMFTTERGEKFFANVERRYVELMNEIAKLSNQATEPESIRIGTLSLFGAQHLYSILVRAQSLNPLIRTHSVRKTSGELVRLLVSNQIDFAFTSEKINLESFRSYKVFEEKIVLCGSKSNLQNFKWRQISQLPMAVYHAEDSFISRFINTNPKLKNRIQIVAQCPDHASLVQYVEELNCFALIPESFLVQNYSDRLEQVYSLPCKNEIFMIYREDVHLSQQMKYFRDYVRQSFAVKSLK